MYNYDVPQSIRDMHKREVGGIRNMIMHEVKAVMSYEGPDSMTLMEIMRVPNGLIYHTYEYTEIDDEGECPLGHKLISTVFVPYEEFNHA